MYKPFLFRQSLRFGVFLLVLFCSACQKQEVQQHIKLAILHDQSDTFSLKPKATWFSTLKPWSDYHSIAVSYETIDHLPLHQSRNYVFKPKQGLWSNDIENKQAKDTFMNQCQALFSSDTAVVSRPKSIIFPVLLRYLKEDYNELHLFSDLRENSFINLYQYKDHQALKTHEAKLKKAFLSQGEIPKGTATIYLYYQAQDYDEGMYYMQLIELYKQLLEPYGYRIHFGQMQS